MKRTTYHDCRALASIQARGLADGVEFSRTTPRRDDDRRMLLFLSSEVVIKNACRRCEEADLIGGNDDSARAAVTIVHAVPRYNTNVLVLECSANLYNASSTVTLTQCFPLSSRLPCRICRNKYHRRAIPPSLKRMYVAAVQGARGSKARVGSCIRAF